MLVNEDSEGRNDFAEFLMVLEFDKIARFALIHIVEVVFCEGSNFFGETVVGEVNGFGRVKLEVFRCFNFFHKKRSFTIGALSVTIRLDRFG